MLPDVVDDFTMKNPACRDLEPLFFSCYAFCSKLAGGLSVGISTLILQFVGYRAGACHHEGGVATALIVMFSPVPVALLLIGMFFFHSYPINERKCLQEQLTPDHPEASSPADLKEDSEQLPSTSHYNTSYNPISSAGPEKQSSVKSSGRSLASSENSRSKSVLKSNVNPQSPTSPQRSGDEKRSGDVPEKNPRTSSSRSHVRPNISWV